MIIIYFLPKKALADSKLFSSRDISKSQSADGSTKLIPKDSVITPARHRPDVKSTAI